MKLKTFFAAALIMTMSLHTALSAGTSSDLKITHNPVTWGVKGQPLTLKARVSGGIGGVKSVTLYYALFRDAAPFRVNMASSGIGLFVGTIESGLLSGVNTISYYIEAEDKGGTIEETPWYDVAFKNPDPSKQTGTQVAPTGGGAPDEDGSAMTIGLIAGGAAAVAVGAYVISDSGSSDSSGSSDDGGDARNKAGTYFGTATTCITIPPAETTCSNTAISILIDLNGKVFSDDLVPGQQLVGDLTGDNFSLQADTSNAAEDFYGTIIFSGTVIGNSSIVGSINGNLTSDGTAGFYSGDFNASK